MCAVQKTEWQALEEVGDAAIKSGDQAAINDTYDKMFELCNQASTSSTNKSMKIFDELHQLYKK